jgi:hypothetical protein
VNFSDAEKRYIIAEKGNWRVSDDCPDKLKELLVQKINNIYRANK